MSVEEIRGGSDADAPSRAEGQPEHGSAEPCFECDGDDFADRVCLTCNAVVDSDYPEEQAFREHVAWHAGWDAGRQTCDRRYRIAGRIAVFGLAVLALALANATLKRFVGFDATFFVGWASCMTFYGVFLAKAEARS